MPPTKLRPKATPPDGGWGWVVVFCSFVNQMLCVGIAMSLGIMFVFWLEEFGGMKSFTSWILSLLFFNMCVIGPLPASMAERYGFKVVTFIGGLIMSLGLAVSYFATSVAFLIVSVGCVMGVGMAFIYLSTFATVALYFDKRRTLANGIGTSGAGIGGFIMPLLMGKLEELYGWRGTMLLLAAMTLHVCAIGLLLRPLEGNPSEWVGQSGDLTLCPDVYVTNCDSGDAMNESSVKDEILVPEEERLIGIDQEKDGRALKSNSVSGRDGEHCCHEIQVQDRGGRNDGEGVAKFGCEETFLHPDNLVVKQIRETSVISRFGSVQLQAASKPENHFASFDDVRFWNHVTRKSLQSLDAKALGSMPSLLNGTYHPVPTSDICNSTDSSIKQNGDRTPDHLTCFQNIQIYLQLLRDKRFLLFAASGLLNNLTLTICLVYMADRAVAEGLPPSSGALIVAFNGVGNVIGRLFFGFAADHFFQSHVTCYMLILGIMGVATALSPLCGDSIELHCLYASIFGATLGGNVVLMVSVTVALMGLEKTTLALGLNLVAIGIGDLIGPPLGGWLYDMSQSYMYSFELAGVLAIVSALILIPLLRKK